MELNDLTPKTPESNTSESVASDSKVALIFSNKAVLIALVLGVVMALIAFSSVFDFGDSSDYQGLIKKVESEVQINN